MKKKTRKKKLGGYPAAGVVISTTLAIFVLGLFGNLLIYSQQFSAVVRENLNVKVYLRNSLTETRRQQMERTLLSKSFVAETAKPLQYISKEEAEKDLIREIGNYKEILGENPLKDVFVIKVKPELQDTVQLEAIRKEIEAMNGVLEVTYEKHLFDDVNRNLKNISIYLLIIAALLVTTTFMLVNNTLRLALFSQRFLIRSMQLVGATKSFILAPFLVRALLYGLLSGLIASVAIWLLSNYIQQRIPEIAILHNPGDFLIMLGILIGTGALVSCCSTFFATRRYLTMSLDDLY